MSSRFPIRATLIACCLSVAMIADADAQERRRRFLRAEDTANSAAVSQTGSGNAGAIVQTGAGNTALLGQVGRNNSGTITQSGDNNSACLFQMGRNLNGAINQTGSNQSIAVVQTPAGAHPVPMHVCASQIGGRRLGQARRLSNVAADFRAR